MGNVALFGRYIFLIGEKLHIAAGFLFALCDTTRRVVYLGHAIFHRAKRTVFLKCQLFGEG